MPDIDTGTLTGAKLHAKCGCAFALKNNFSSCEIVNETMHTKKEAAVRKMNKKTATQKRVQDKKKAAAKIKKSMKAIR